ncbi:MAG: transketolase [Planctomycetes bacterium]|jgi:transketolase|nr:transketolase [Planctomycetota bacterium]
MQINLPISEKFEQPTLTNEQILALDEWRRLCSGYTILATTVAKSGHPGGSLSTIPLLLAAYAGIANQAPDNVERDRIIVSHGHVAPAVYSILAGKGYFPIRDVILQLRRAGSRYAGHVEVDVPGIEWGTGNLGQGLSVGTASAFAGKKQNLPHRTFVFMGDGEHQKGQISEARRFAVKEHLNNLIGVLDYNELQIGGSIHEIMPQNIIEEYKADGWNVLEVDGKDLGALYKAMADAYHSRTEKKDMPTLIFARTVMGNGISFMENKHEYHGKPLTRDQAVQAMQELNVAIDVDYWLNERKNFQESLLYKHITKPYPKIQTGTPRLYPADDKTENRAAYGNALYDLATANQSNIPKIFGITCDVISSVKMDMLANKLPQNFIECGIQEHHAATMAGRLSTEGVAVFFSTFGVFGAGETYNQLRLNTMNNANVKVVCTHVGLNVGEDGPTHQAIDYIGLVSNTFGIRIGVPADANQTDRMIRKIATLSGCDFVAIGRSRTPIILDEQGKIFYGSDFEYIPGKADWIRCGKDATIIAIGPMVHVALQARELLLQKNIEVGVLNMASVLPLDRDALRKAASYGPIVTIEDHHIQTGLGSIVANAMAEESLFVPFAKLGVTRYQSSGLPDALYQIQGLTPENTAKTIQQLLTK